MPKPSRPGARLRCESLEARDVPATFYPATVADLVAAVGAANASAGADTIVLSAGGTYTLTAVNNTGVSGTSLGPTGLPVVEADGGSLVIVGNGATVERSTATGTPAFRLVAVEPGASLTAENLTLQNGRIDSGQVYVQAWGGYGAAGGAVLNQGTTVLKNVVVQNNVAAGVSGFPASPYGFVAAGGGIYSDGSLAITGGSIRNNQALGGDSARGMDGAPGLGGGVYVGGGTAGLTGVTLADNTARGGAGGEGYWVHSSRVRYRVLPGDGGTGAGGGLYASSAVVTLESCTVSGNKALGGSGGEGYGGGVYVGYGASADWDSETRFSRNRASTSGNDFYRL